MRYNRKKGGRFYASFSSHTVVPVTTIVKLKALLGGLSLAVSVRRICARSNFIIWAMLLIDRSVRIWKKEKIVL